MYIVFPFLRFILRLIISTCIITLSFTSSLNSFQKSLLGSDCRDGKSGWKYEQAEMSLLRHMIALCIVSWDLLELFG